jgi:hypothetical protein
MLHSRVVSCVSLISLLTLTGLFHSTSDAALIDNTVAAWLFDEGEGDVATDSVNDHDGSFEGGVDWTTDAKFGNALEFDGQQGSWVEVPDAPELSLDTWSITAWVKQGAPIDSTDGWSTVLVKDPACGLQNYALTMAPSGLVVAEHTSASNWSDSHSFTSVFDEEWHFLAGSYDGEVLQVWVDGELEGEQFFGPPDQNDASVVIGNRMNACLQPLFGVIDDLALFNVALQEDDIIQLRDLGLAAVLGLGQLVGDFSGNGSLDVADIDALTGQSASGSNPAEYDLTSDALVNEADVKAWISDLYHSWVGDANLDGEFNSSDLVTALAAGTYEMDTAAVWSTGDFNGDGRFNSSDLVAALADGGYETGPRPAAAVPEPHSVIPVLCGLLALVRGRRSRR